MGYPKIRVYVKNEHIALGQRRYKENGYRSNSCPLARALRDAGFKNAIVINSKHAWFDEHAGLITPHYGQIDFSPKVTLFIQSADKNRLSTERLQPFSFLIEVQPRPS